MSMHPFRTCRFCKETTQDLIKYSARHYAHLSCLKEAYKPMAFERLLWKLSVDQLGNLKHTECVHLEIQFLVRSIYTKRTYVHCSACNRFLPPTCVDAYGLCGPCTPAVHTEAQ